MSDFLLSDIAQEFIVDELYFIDEIVIKFSERLPSKERDFEIERLAKIYAKDDNSLDSYNEIDVSKEDFNNYYLLSEDLGLICYFWLNYSDFENKFPIDIFKDDLKNDFHSMLHYFENAAVDYVLDSKNDYTTKDKIVKVLNRLKSANSKLNQLLNTDHGVSGIYKIQEIVIDTLLRRNSRMIEVLSKRFTYLFPDFEYLKNFNQSSSKNGTYNISGFSKKSDAKNRVSINMVSNEIIDLSENYLLNSIEDIDDFILKNGYMGISPPDISGITIEREYFHFEQDGSTGKHDKLLLSKEEYENETFGTSFTKLNYEEFINDFDLGSFALFLRDQYLLDEYNDGFRPLAIDYINNAEFEGQSKYRLKEVVQTLAQASYDLNKINCYWYFNDPLNEIQKTVIKLFTSSYRDIKKALLIGFKNIYPEVVNEFILKTKEKESINKETIPDFFKKPIYFISFKKYIEKDWKYPIKDFGYIFKRLLSEDKIHKKTDMEFAAFLRDEEFINQNIYDQIVERGQFDSLNKSKSKLREEIYNQYFH